MPSSEQAPPAAVQSSSEAKHDGTSHWLSSELQLPRAAAHMAASQVGTTQLSPSHVPPAAVHEVGSHAGGTMHSPSTQLPPLRAQVSAGHVITQASPVQ